MKNQRSYYKRRALKNNLAHILFTAAAWVGVLILLFLLFDLVKRGAQYIIIELTFSVWHKKRTN